MMSEEPENLNEFESHETLSEPSDGPIQDHSEKAEVVEVTSGPEPERVSKDPVSNGGSEKPSDPTGYAHNIRRILDIQLPVTVSFGTTHRNLREVLKLSPGALIELDRSAEDPVVLKINGKPFAWGHVVDVDGYYGVEITEILTQADRIASLGGD